MAIRPLGKETALLLRASALVVTPLLLVKELVDNAIDAKATSVKVQMGRDCVNQIEVQDNGIGIRPDDFGALGRRGHTSKLKTLQDLPWVAGTSLGFRGEALAAANSVAEVTITTRTSQEKVGHRLCLEPKGGGIKKHELVSVPVGTTVRVQNLFASIPVRKKITTDNIQKSLVDVKHLLQAYALARPGIRLFFGVFGDNNVPWSYSPVGTPTVREAAFQVFGKDVAAQYTNVTLTETASSPDNRLVAELIEHTKSGITVDAFLPKQYTDLAAVSKKRVFISVDGRPMTSGSGTVKKVMTAFKARFDSFHHHQNTQFSASNIFIQLDIRCPPGSYDVNISPAKDEVLFTDEPRVLKVIDHLLKVSYPAIKKAGAPDGGASNDGELDELSSGDLQLLESSSIGSGGSLGPVLEPMAAGTRQLAPLPEVEETTPDLEDDNIIPDTAWIIDMSNPCDEGSILQPTSASVIDQLRNAATRAKKQGEKTGVTENREEDRLPVHATASEPHQATTYSPGSWAPVGNASNPWLFAIERAKAKQPYDDPGSFTTNSAFELGSDEVNPALPTDLRPGSMFLNSPSPDTPPNGLVLCTPSRIPALPTTGTLLTPPSSGGCNPRQRNVLPRFNPPATLAPRDRPPQASHSQARARQGQQRTKASNHEAPVPPYDKHQALNGPYLNVYMGKMNTRTRQHSPGKVSRVNGLPPATSVGTKETSALGDGGHTTMDDATAKSPNQHDPRKYLMRRRRSMSRDRRTGRVLRRVKSAPLSLEAIPKEQEMHTFSLGISTSHTDLGAVFSRLADIDSYVSTGTYPHRLLDDLDGAGDIETRLQPVCSDWVQRTTGRGCDLRFDLRARMKGKSCG